MPEIHYQAISENNLQLTVQIIDRQQDMHSACQFLQKLCKLILQKQPQYIIELTPAYNRLLITYCNISAEHLKNQIKQLINQMPLDELQQHSKIHEIAVCYHSSFAVDLPALCQKANIDIEEAIQLHTQQTYSVFALGFSPGFAYLGDVDEKLSSQRHATPRAQVEAGSVGIADRQTAIYPMSSPGGWQIIGRSPQLMFDLQRKPHCPIQVGDQVRFKAISLEEYKYIISSQGQQNHG